MGWGLVAVQRVADCATASASLGQDLPQRGAACSTQKQLVIRI